MEPNTEPSGLVAHLIAQWMVWVAAVALGALALFLSTQQYGEFNAVWFGVLAVGLALYALRNTGGAAWVRKRSGW